MAHGTSLLPPTEYLTQTPVICGAGTSFVHECRGSSEGAGRYIYAIFNRTNFWRYDIWTDAWQQLTSPPVVAAAVFGAGVAMCMDTSRAQIYLWTPTAGGNWCNFERYDIASDTWIVRSVLAGLIAQWGTDTQLLHLCRQENTTAIVPPDLAAFGVGDVLDNHIYLMGNGAVTLYRYNINTTAGGVADTWNIIVPTAARAAPPGAGATLNWMPDRAIGATASFAGNDVLYSFRGGGAVFQDRFVISTAAWVQDTVGMETYTTGTCSVYDVTDVPSVVMYHNTTMSLHAFAINSGPPASAIITPMSTFTGTDGVAHVGNLLTYVRFDDGTTYYYMAKHSERAFMRILRTI